jgi:ribosome biogenesis GTPase A
MISEYYYRRPVSRLAFYIMLSVSMSRVARASFRRNTAAAFVGSPTLSTQRYSYPPTSSRIVSYSSINQQDFDELTESGYKRPPVSWYPGHIAKAEKQLSETLKAVDVVVEVRDARACKATAHPRVGEWCAGRPRIVVLTHLDMIPKVAAASWRKSYEMLGAERWDDAPINTQVANQAQQARDIRFSYGDPNDKKNKKSNKKEKTPKVVTPVDQVMFINAKQGQGIHALQRAILKAGAHVQERRERRGLKTRALRVGIIGYPNVGKSALINRILGRRRAKTANTPGVTRSLQWIRVRTDESKTHKREFELLDSPGIIPAKMVDQSDALLLAACNCIGQAAYDNQAVAAYLCEWLKTIHVMKKQHLTAPKWRPQCQERYAFDPMEPKDAETGELLTGEDMLFLVADNTCQGDPEDAARKILQDFRNGRMGPVSLQLAPETEDDEGQLAVRIGDSRAAEARASLKEQREKEQQERARMAVETAKKRGLGLPPIVENEEGVNDQDVGKGMFDGW